MIEIHLSEYIELLEMKLLYLQDHCDGGDYDYNIQQLQEQIANLQAIANKE